MIMQLLNTFPSLDIALITLSFLCTIICYSFLCRLRYIYKTVFHIDINPFVLPNLEPKCVPGDPILYPESIFCYSP